MVLLSVIICSHNPRPDYFCRVLDALRAQTLPLDHWELIIVDNRSDQLLEGQFDLSWHPHGRHAREEIPGLSYARRRGVLEARGDLIVFVDDDNVLDPGYLAVAKDLMADDTIGALGGAGMPIFVEGVSPPPHFYNFATWLACGAQLGDPTNVAKQVADLTHLYYASLFGAGLIVRRADMMDLFALPDFPVLSGRKGAHLSSGEDYEICHLIALKGKRLIYAAELKFGHIISASRLDPVYLARLALNTAHRDPINCYVWARRLVAQGFTFSTAARLLLKAFAWRISRVERFALALHFGVMRIAARTEHPIFRNVRGALNYRQAYAASSLTPTSA